MRHLIVFMCLSVLGVACRSGAVSLALDPTEVVVGRARAGDTIWLITNAERLVQLSLLDQSITTHEVTGLRPGQETWGLASSGSGHLWTLVDWSTIAQLTQEGRAELRLPLPTRYLGLYGFGDGVLVQPATVVPQRQVLEWLRPGERVGAPIGSLRLVTFSSRAETLVRNLVGCGSTVTSETPCWFNQDLRVDRIDADGTSRLLELQGVEYLLRPQPDPTRLDQPGPIIDVHIGADHSLWVLLREPIAGGDGHLLARYAPDGTQSHLRRLDRRVRLILDANNATCRLLAGSGQIHEVVFG